MEVERRTGNLPLKTRELPGAAQRAVRSSSAEQVTGGAAATWKVEEWGSWWCWLTLRQLPKGTLRTPSRSLKGNLNCIICKACRAAVPPWTLGELQNESCLNSQFCLIFLTPIEPFPLLMLCQQHWPEQSKTSHKYSPSSSELRLGTRPDSGVHLTAVNLS